MDSLNRITSVNDSCLPAGRRVYDTQVTNILVEYYKQSNYVKTALSSTVLQGYLRIHFNNPIIHCLSEYLSGSLRLSVLQAPTTNFIRTLRQVRQHLVTSRKFYQNGYSEKVYT